MNEDWVYGVILIDFDEKQQTTAKKDFPKHFILREKKEKKEE